MPGISNRVGNKKFTGTLALKTGIYPAISMCLLEQTFVRTLLFC